MGQLKSAEPSTRLDDLLDQRHIFRAKFPTTEPLMLLRYLHAIVLSLLSRSKAMASCPVKNVRAGKIYHGFSRITLKLKKRVHITLDECYLGNNQHIVGSKKSITDRFQAVFRSF
jgi:hypothetical protein